MDYANPSAAAPSPSSSGNPSSDSSGGGSGGRTGNVSTDVLVHWLVIGQLCILALCFLTVFPRAIARFSTYAEWTRGLLLTKGPPIPFRISPPLRVQQEKGGLYDDVNLDASEESFGYIKSTKSFKVHADPTENTQSLPSRIRSFTSLVHPLSSFFCKPVVPGVALGSVLLVLAYFGAIGFITVYQSEPFTRPKRLGVIAVSQMPAVFTFASKGNLAGMLLGIGYEKLNFFHRWVGVMIFVTSNLHTLGYVYKYMNDGVMMEQLQRPMIIWGIVAQAGIELTFFASLPFVRNRSYGFFLFTHIVGYIIFPIFVCLHEDDSIMYAVIGAIIFGLDHVARLFKTRVTTATVKTIPELGMIHVDCRSVRGGWRAGQHVRVRVLSREMGLFGWAVAHPFTIASTCEGENGQGLVLLVKKVGSWTTNLYNAAQRAGYYGAENGLGFAASRSMSVIIEGPYGGLGHMVLSSYSSAMIVAGGSGVSFALAAAEELIQQAVRRTSRVRFIEIVWVVQSQDCLDPLVPAFSSILDQCDQCPYVKMRITVYHTRAKPEADVAMEELKSPVGPFGGNLNVNRPLPKHKLPFPGLQLRSGRPKLGKILGSLCSRTEALRDPSGIAVCVCGPIGLAEDVAKTARGVHAWKANALGGIEVHEETFGW